MVAKLLKEALDFNYTEGQVLKLLDGESISTDPIPDSQPPPTDVQR